MMLSCRKRGPRALVVAGTVVLVLAAAAAAAQAQTPKGRVSITGQVGGCIPALSDVNKDIRLGNEALRRYGWSSMDQIGVGYTFTADLRARVFGPFALSLGIGKSSAHTDINFDEIISVKPKMDFYHARIFYDLPVKLRPRMFLRVGAGPVFATKAEVAVRHERRRVEGGIQWIETATFHAKGTGGHALIESEMMLNQKTTLVIDLGYRLLSLTRSGNANDFRDWSRAEVQTPNSDTDGDGIPNLWDLADTREGQGYISASFLEVVNDQSGRPVLAPGTSDHPLVRTRGMDKIDFSGPQASVGLRFYLF
jgi:hypothetical protein